MRRSRRAVLHYVAAAGVVTLAVALSMTLEPLLEHVPTVGVGAAVLLIAWLAGLGPALFATLVAAGLLAGAPPHEAPGHALAQNVGIAIFVAVSATVAWLAAGRRRVEREWLAALARERAARADAERLGRAKDDFLAMLSHELRSPLTAILGWLLVLRRTVPGEGRTGQAIETIERNTLLQSRVIDDLLDVSRIVTGKLELHRQAVDAVAILRHVLASLEPSAQAKGLQLNERSERGPVYVLADRQRLEQVFGNVVGNAIKFTPAGGEIVACLATDGGRVRITVRDTGQGIDPEVLPHIFDRFHQGADGRAFGGLGLGLAIVHHLVAQHGGAIRAESAGRGCGARFVIELPLLDQPASRVTQSRNAAPRSA